MLDPLTATERGGLAAEEQALSNPALLNEGFPPEIRLAAESRAKDLMGSISGQHNQETKKNTPSSRRQKSSK